MTENNGNNFVVEFNGPLKFKAAQLIDEAYEKGYNKCKSSYDLKLNKISDESYKKGYQQAIKDYRIDEAYQKGYDACKIEHEYKELIISNNKSISEVLNNLYKDIDNYYHECLSYCAEQDQKCRHCTSTTFGRILDIINNYKNLEKKE